MTQKIRYRLVYNYSGRLNQNGTAPVALECRQENKKIYVSSKVCISPEQWNNGAVTNHPLASKLSVYLVRWKHQMEEIELDAILCGKKFTLSQLKNAIRSNSHPRATIKDFVNAIIITDSSRCKSTKQTYIYMADEIERDYGTTTIEDITYDFIVRYRDNLRKKNLSENTVKGKLKTLRCIVSEALRRDIIQNDPFKNITIGNIEAKRNDYLTQSDVRRLENAQLKGKYAHIRDAFLFCCYTGLRYGDFTRLTDKNFIRNKLVIVQQKTKTNLELPLGTLFGGKPLEILERYKSVKDFTDIGHNSTVNKLLKETAIMAHVKKSVHFHTARKTCGTILNQMGLKMQEIQKVLGHTLMGTTSKYYATTSYEQVEKSLKKAFKI